MQYQKPHQIITKLYNLSFNLISGNAFVCHKIST